MSKGPNYEAYVKAYYKKQAILERKGLKMRDQLLTEEEFKFAYKVERDAMLKLVKEGKRRVVGNITQNIVSSQSYEKTFAQGKALKVAYQNLGIDVSVQGIREGSAEAKLGYEALKNKWLELANNPEAKSIIAKEIFGS